MALTTYKRKVKLSPLSQKVKSLKQLKALFLGKYAGLTEEDTFIEAQCGARFVYGLDEDSKTTDIVCWLLSKFYHENGEKKIAQIVFSDTVDEYGRKTWKDVKANCHKGPISVNPNSDTRIQFYIVVPQDLVAIYNAQFK